VLYNTPIKCKKVAYNYAESLTLCVTTSFKITRISPWYMWALCNVVRFYLAWNRVRQNTNMLSVAPRTSAGKQKPHM
jgi:hypothetical protein